MAQPTVSIDTDDISESERQLHVLVSASILRSRGWSLERAALEATTLEILIRRGPMDEIDDDQPF